jgi:hypothetical protein
MTSYSLNFKSDSTLAQIPTAEILQQIPNISEKIKHFSPGVHQRIDLLLLGLEALNVGGTERILKISQQLGLKDIIKNRIFLWRLRCTNPLRRSYQRNYLTMEEVKALVVIIHHLAKSFEVKIRQHLIDTQMMREKGLPVDNHYHLSDYLEKFRNNFANRMNPRRVKVMNYLDNEDMLNDLALSILTQLLLSSGSRGIERLWVSLWDGEVN